MDPLQSYITNPVIGNNTNAVDEQSVKKKVATPVKSSGSDTPIWRDDIQASTPTLPNTDNKVEPAPVDNTPAEKKTQPITSGSDIPIWRDENQPAPAVVTEAKKEPPAPVENVNDFTGKTMLSDVDAEISKTVKELKASNSTFGAMAREVIGIPGFQTSKDQTALREHFLELTEKKRNIERQMLIPPEKLQRDVMPALTDPKKFNEIMADPQYSPNQITKAINNVLDKGAAAKEKVDNDIITSMGGISFSSITDYVKNRDNNIMPDEIDRMYTELSKRPDYIDGDYKEKQSVIRKFVESKLKDQEYATPAAKLKQANEYRHELGLKYAFAGTDANGNAALTMEGTKMFIENQRNILMTHRNDLVNDLHDLRTKDPEYAKKLSDLSIATNSAFHIGKNADAYLEYHYSQINKIDEAVRAYDKALAAPEKKRGFKDFVPDIPYVQSGLVPAVNAVLNAGAELGKGMISPLKNAVDRNSLLTLGVSDIFTSLNLKAVTDKEMSGDQLTFAEKHNLQSAATIAATAGFNTTSLGYDIGAAVTAMLPYVATYGVTEPIYEFGMTRALKGITAAGRSLVPEAARASITKALTFTTKNKFLVKAGFNNISTVDVLAKNLARVSGSALQTLANPQTLIPDIIGKMTPKIGLNATIKVEDLKKDSELNNAINTINANDAENSGINISPNATNQLENIKKGQEVNVSAGIIPGSEQKIGEALWKGGLNQFANIYTERFGGVAERFVSKAKLGIGLDLDKLGKMVVLKNLMALKGVKSIKDFDLMKRLSWHGAGYEYLEEVANNFVAAPAQEGGLGLDNPQQFIHQQLVTLGSILAFSPMMGAVSSISEKTVGKNVVFEMPTKDSETPAKKVSLPRPLYNQLMKVMGIGDIENVDTDKLTNFLTFHRPNLNADQVNLIMQLYVDTSKKKYAAQMLKANPNLAAEPDLQPLDKVPNETDTPGPHPNVIKQKKIKDIEDQRKELLDAATTDKQKASINKRLDKRIEAVKNAPERFQTKVRDLATGKLKYVDMSPEEVAATKVENDRILSENSDLFDAGLLRHDPVSNQWVEPTPQSLMEDLGNVTKELQTYQGSKYETALNDPHGFTPENDKDAEAFQRYTQLINQHDAIKEKLVEVHANDIPFQELGGEEKAQRLTNEIKQNGNIEGTAQKTATNRFGIKLSDGRLINAAIDMDLPPAEKKAAQAAIARGTKIVLQNRSHTEYDPNLEQSWGDGTPVMSKVTAYTPKGLRLGSVLINSEPDSKKIREEKNKKVIADATAKLESVPPPGPQLRSMVLPGNVNDAVAPKQHMDKNFLDMLKDVTSNLNVPIDTFIPTLNSIVQNSNIAPELKQKYLEHIDKNQQQLIDRTVSERATNLAKENAAQKAAAKIDTTDLTMDETDSVFLSGDQKMAQQLNTFGKIWRKIAVVTGISKDKVERTFFKIANGPAWEYVTNETTYNDFLENLITANTLDNAIVGAFKELGLTKAQSFFQFYRNVEMVPQIATLYTKGKITFKTLNSSEALPDLIETTKFTLANYKYKNIAKGFESIRYRMASQDQETETRFQNWPDKTPAELNQLRHDQFDADKQLLEDITGIPAETWDTYFQDPKTKEMEAQIDGTNKNAPKINLKTYDAYLNSMTYRYSQAGKAYPRWHSQLVYSLLDLRKSAGTLSDFTDAVDSFFTKGNEEKNTFSNLAKLATSSATDSNLGLSGDDVSRNRFSSLVQNNSIFYRLHHLDDVRTAVPSRNVVVGYQGVSGYPDGRQFNYYTQNEEEARDYGSNVSRITIDTSNFLRKGELVDGKYQWTKEYEELVNQFKKETGLTFDILDNSPEGLKIQEQFFKGLESLGYDGYTQVVADTQPDGAYFVTFNDKSKVDDTTTGRNVLKDKPVNYVVNNDLKNPDGSKKLASSNLKENRIQVNESTTVEEFFKYIEGAGKSISSEQKRLVMERVQAEGYDLNELIKTHDDVLRFLYLHEQSHLDNRDADNYWKNGKSLLTDDKLDIEVRATVDALKGLALEKHPSEEANVNNLLAWLKSDPKNLNYFFLNGISDTKGDNNNAQKMTTSDILISLLSDFTQSENKYNQWTGQYGDKTHMLMLSVPKYTAEQLKEVKQNLKNNGIDLQKTVDFVRYHTITRNGDAFENSFGKPLKQAKNETKEEFAVRVEERRQEVNDQLESFVLNFTRNITDINEITRGNWSQYAKKGLVEFVKRGATSISPFMALNSNIEGGIGQSYKFASVIDEYLGEDKQFDGMTFFSDPWSKKLQVTLGGIYAKTDQYPRLSSAKLLHAGINSETGNEAITKANWLNIDMLADELGGKWAELRDFMNSQKLDVVSVRSSTKKHENGDEAHIKLWDDNGKVLSKADIPDGGIVDRRTDQLGYQQDLRHSTQGKLSKTPSAILGNILGLPHGSDILSHMQDIQDNELKDLTDLFNSEQSEAVKIKWLKDNVNEQNQGQLLKLLNRGLSIHDPYFKNIINTIVASAITKKVLEVPMMRITSQELLDVDHVLKGRERSKSSPEHIHLPEAMAAIEGGRASNFDYVGKIAEAIKYVMDNKNQHLDLFDSQGKLMDWIITDKDGKIPGEPFVSVRVPTDDYRSFTVARLEKNLTSGNFTMLDRESQKASGSDADGDQRFNLLLSKSRSGKMTQGVTGEKMSNLSLNNLIIMDLVHDYQSEVNDIRIRSGINVEQFDPLIAKELGEVRSPLDIESYFKARSENIVGLTTKGMFTDLLTTVNILQKYHIRLNKPVSFHDYTIDGIVNDRWGLIKLAMANIQNMSFDNASKPRIEHLGFNEHTSPMIFALLMGNKAINSDEFQTREQQAAVIDNEMAKIKEMFTTDKNHASIGDIAGSFRDYMREENDALTKKNMKGMWSKLTSEYKDLYPRGVEEFKKLYEVGQDLNSIRQYFALSKEVPDSYAKFRIAQNLHEKMSLVGLTHFNTRSFFTVDHGVYTPIGVFKMIPKILDILKKTVYADMIDETPVGKSIYDRLIARHTLRQKAEKFGDMRTQDFAAISHALNTIAAIRSLEEGIITRSVDIQLIHEIMGKAQGITSVNIENESWNPGSGYTFRQIEKRLLESINDIRKQYPGNKFFNYTTKMEVSSKDKINSPVSYGKKNSEGESISFVSFEIDSQFHHSPISQEELQSIRDDFDKFDEKTKDLLTLYALYKWGPSMSRNRGSYISFIGDQYHVELSQFSQIEHDKWAHNELSDREIHDILQWTTIASRSDRIRPEGQYTDSLIDIHALPFNQMSGITAEASKELMEIEKIPKGPMQKVEMQKAYSDWIGKWSIDVEDLRNAAKKFYDLPKDAPAPVIKFIKELTDLDKKSFELRFPPRATPTELKSMMPYHAINNILLTEDPQLRDYTYARMKEVFPDVQFFSSRQAFYDFVEKHEGSLRDASPEAIGHAFKQAIFIDGKRAIQETIMHEHGHIYWDGLPDTNRAKIAMQKLYNEIFAGKMSQEDIDETIILDIGRAGSDIAKISLRGSAIEKFKLRLRQFWIEVKKLFGQANRGDMIEDLAYDVWRNAENIRPSTNQGRDAIRDMAEHNSDDDVAKFEKEGHKHTIGGRVAVSVTEIIHLFKNFGFDIEERSYGKQGLINFEYLEQTGEIRSKEKNDADASNLQKHWMDTATGGTALHLVAQAVFNHESLTEQGLKDFAEVKKQFAPGVYEDTIATFEKMKDILIVRYGPHIKFISEKQLISKKYMVSGLTDLIIDLGNDKDGNSQIILVDYKSVGKALVSIDEDTGEPVLEPSYTKSLGSFQKPFTKIPQSKQMEHSIQLNIYANMAEEELNENGGKTIVKGLIIFPIIRKLGLDGKITQATLTHHVDVKRNASSKKLSQEMMNFSWKQREIMNEEGLKYAKVLTALHYHPDSIKTMIKALSFFQSYTRNDIAGTKTFDEKTGELDPNAGLRWNVMDNMIDGSYAKMISKLYELGFESDDITGNLDKDILPLPLEHMFYIALSDRPITKKEYTENMDTYFPLLPVDVSYQWQENPNYSGNRYSHQKINGKDVYGREIGWNSDEIGKGTRVGIYVNIQKEDGTFEKDFIQGTIENVDKALRTITINTDNGKTITRKTPDPESGILELFDKKDLPQTPEKMGIEPNKFEPKWLSILTEKKERHHVMLEQDSEPFKNNTQKYDLYKSDTKKIQRYFAQIEKENKEAGKAPIDALKSFLNDKDKTINMYNSVREMEKNAAGLFTSFMESISMSHQLAEKVRTEYQYGANDLMHFMIDTYRYLTIQDNVLFQNFGDSWFNGRGGEFVPSGEIEGSHIPFQLITAMTNDAENGLAAEEYRVKKLWKKLEGKFRFEDITTPENANGEIYYLKPSEIKQNQFPEMHEYLSALYHYYYKYDPRYQGQNNEDYYPIPIKLRKTFASEHELQTKYGISSKFSGRFRDMMRANEYDNIKVPLQVLKNGKWVEDHPRDKNGKLIRDSKGNILPAKVKTLKEIKDQWSYENMTDTERRQFLGDPISHKFTWPGQKFKTAADQPNSQLLRYYHLAEQVMSTNGDKNNPQVFRQRQQLTARGSTNLLRYQTQRYYENEESIIVSMISAYYKRELIAPWKFMAAKYQKILTPEQSSGPIQNLSDISKYLNKWGEFMIFDNKNPESTKIMEKMSFGVDWLNKMASRSKIMYTLKTQLFNFLAGQTSALLRYPKQYRTGWKRIIQNRKKAFNILRTYKVASFTDQLMMERIDREWRMFGVNLSWIENMGYWLVEHVEKVNQIGTYIGFMTEKEWNAYDSDAEIIPGQEFNALSPTRQTAIANKLYKTQGHYGKTAMAPGWLGAGSKAALGLKRYIPGYYWAMALRHSRISDLADSGILPTLKLLGKVMMYNNSPEQVREHRLTEAKLTKMANEGIPDVLLFEKSVKDAFQKILQENTDEKGIIKFRELSENDKSNIYTTIRAISLYALTALGLAALGGGGGDDEKIRTKIAKGLTKTLSRFQNDIFMIQGPQSLTDQLKRLAAPVAFDMIYSAGKLTSSTIALLNYGFTKASTGVGEGEEKAFYVNAPNTYVPKGFPRAVVDFLRIAPGGNAFTQVWQIEADAKLHFTFVPEVRFEDANIDDTMLELLHGDKKGLNKLWSDMIWNAFADKSTDSHVNKYEFTVAEAKLIEKQKLLKDYEEYKQFEVEGDKAATIKNIQEYFAKKEASKAIVIEAGKFASLANAIRTLQEYENEGIDEKQMKEAVRLYNTLKKNAGIESYESKIKKGLPAETTKKDRKDLMKGSLQDLYNEVNQ